MGSIQCCCFLYRHHPDIWYICSRSLFTKQWYGKRLILNVTIGKLPDDGLVADTASHTLAELGLTVQTLTPGLAEQLGYQGETGVVITQVNPGTITALAGLRPGTLILEINRKQVQNIDEFKKALTQNGKKGLVLLRVRDGKYSHYITLNIKK